MVNFVSGQGVAKAARHIDVKQYYIEEQVLKGKLHVS
jgi:hypothetical protein